MSTSNSVAVVKSSTEFGAATVATSISLATVILAFAELAPYMGLWLLWAAATTAIGLVAVRYVAPLIWKRMDAHRPARLTLHHFLGDAYGSRTLVRIGAVCTSLGFLGAFAIELTVGARFLAALVPDLSSFVTACLLAGVGLLYTVMGGFRAVVVTDRVQMWAIWAAIIALGISIANSLATAGELAGTSPPILAESIYDFSWREGLGSFLIGIFIINVPTFIGDMSVWQRIAGAPSAEVISEGLYKSMVGAAVSWTGLVLIACALTLFIAPGQQENPLFTYTYHLIDHVTVASVIIYATVVLGLYAASLSTASTQLIAAVHSIQTDVLFAEETQLSLASSSDKLFTARAITVGVAVVAVIIVEALRRAGLGIADMVFAVYGSQLGLVPAVIGALFFRQELTRRIRRWALAGVTCGFVAGWSAAIAGKLNGNSDLVFLAPAFSLIVSGLLIYFGAMRSTFGRTN